MPELHKHLHVDVSLNNPPTCPRVVEDWLAKLVKAVDMEIFIPPQAKYCDDPNNAGVTGIVVITTSHCSIHVWSECDQPYAMIDLYSCKDFEPSTVLMLLAEFKPIRINYNVIERGLHLDVPRDLEKGFITDFNEFYRNQQAKLQVLQSC